METCCVVREPNRIRIDRGPPFAGALKPAYRPWNHVPFMERTPLGVAQALRAYQCLVRQIPDGGDYL